MKFMVLKKALMNPQYREQAVDEMLTDLLVAAYQHRVALASDKPTSSHEDNVETLRFGCLGFDPGRSGLEPPTHGFSVRCSAYKSFIRKSLQCDFEPKTRVTSGLQVSNKWSPEVVYW